MHSPSSENTRFDVHQTNGEQRKHGCCNLQEMLACVPQQSLAYKNQRHSPKVLFPLCHTHVQKENHSNLQLGWRSFWQEPDVGEPPSQGLLHKTEKTSSHPARAETLSRFFRGPSPDLGCVVFVLPILLPEARRTCGASRVAESHSVA